MTFDPNRTERARVASLRASRKFAHAREAAPPRTWRRVFVAAWICVLSLLASDAVRAGDSSSQDKAAKEYELKAALIYKFANYVTWPKDSFQDEKAPLVVGVLGKDPFDGKLDEVLKDKKVDTHPIVVKHLAKLDDTLKIHILFVAATENGSLDRIIEIHKGSPTLIVGDSLEFAERGGCIGLFINEEKKLRLAINSKVAKAATFKISSDLMKVAQLVSDKEPTK
jgi:hypothetical protein